VFKVKGKQDNEWKPLAAWDDKECPEFSSPHWLVIWLAASGIKKGKLFPVEADVGKVFNPTKALTYNSFLKIMKKLCTEFLQRRKEKLGGVIFGTHMLRKTGILLAYWGYARQMDIHSKGAAKPPGAEDINQFDIAAITSSARHKSVSSTVTYMGACAGLYCLFKRNESQLHHHRVGLFEPINVACDNNFATLNTSSTRYMQPLNGLADWYVFKVIGAEPGSGPLKLCKRFMEHTKAPKVNNLFHLRSLLASNLPNLCLVENVMHYVKLISDAATEVARGASPLVAQMIGLTGPQQQGALLPVPKKRKVAPVDKEPVVLPDTVTQLPKTTLSEKVAYYRAYNKEVLEQKKEGKYMKDMKPVYWHARVLDSIDTCYDGNEVKWQDKNSTSHSRFEKCAKCLEKHVVSFAAEQVL
jgi:hypothetical protein